jgi:hypothetical protein
LISGFILKLIVLWPGDNIRGNLSNEEKIMPATFAHCLMAQKAIDKILNEPKKGKSKKILEFIQKIGEKNNFLITGAAGPDYPYLTEILTTVVLQIGHTWANRMHYENTLLFVKEGVKSLSGMDINSDAFSIRLAWFCGFISHVMADSFVHPVVINCLILVLTYKL